MPNVYVIENDTPNAFATGRGPKHSAVCVTAGLRQLLNEQELAGVVAHELAHIKNRDVLISTIAAMVAGSTELRAIATYHTTRVIHGLEHATLTVLEERGVHVRGGQTSHGMFALELDHDNALRIKMRIAAPELAEAPPPTREGGFVRAEPVRHALDSARHRCNGKSTDSGNGPVGGIPAYSILGEPLGL